MAFNSKNQPLMLSLLDRLLDDSASGDPDGASSSGSLARVIRGVQRDLQNLLNTRWRCETSPELEELDQSLVNYGIPDFTGIRFSSVGEQEALRAAIEDVIRRYEPRFVEVRVMIEAESGEQLDRVLRFRIEALLEARPAPESVVFDTTVETITGEFAIKGAN